MRRRRRGLRGTKPKNPTLRIERMVLRRLSMKNPPPPSPDPRSHCCLGDFFSSHWCFHLDDGMAGQSGLNRGCCHRTTTTTDKSTVEAKQTGQTTCKAFKPRSCMALLLSRKAVVWNFCSPTNSHASLWSGPPGCMGTDIGTFSASCSPPLTSLRTFCCRRIPSPTVTPCSSSSGVQTARSQSPHYQSSVLLPACWPAVLGAALPSVRRGTSNISRDDE